MKTGDQLSTTQKIRRIEKICKATIVIAMLMLGISSAFAGEPSEPHDANAMWVEPSTVDLTGRSVGYLFNVTVWVNSSLEECASWEFMLIYDKTLLKATGCGYTAGGKSQFFENINTLVLDPSFADINVTHAYVLHAELWGMSGPYRGPGYGSLSWIEFNLTAVPIDTLLVFNPDITETYIQNSDQTMISLSTYDCYVIPEFSGHLILTLMILLTLAVAILPKKIRSCVHKQGGF